LLYFFPVSLFVLIYFVRLRLVKVVGS